MYYFMRKISKYLTLLLYLSFFNFNICCVSKKKIPPIKINDRFTLDSILDKYVQNGSYPFLYARLEHIDGNVIYDYSAINADLLPNTSINAGTWIRIWSMSKIVTISVAMDLVEDGLLHLEDPVTKYIPEFKNLNVAVDGDGLSLVTVEDLSLACPFQLKPVDFLVF